MINLIETQFSRVSLDESKRLLMAEWKSETEKMEPDQMRNQIETFVKLIQHYKPRYVFSNDKKNKYIYKVNEQEWVANRIAEAFVKYGIERFALLLPEELISELATEQTVEEVGYVPYEQKYVKSEEEAMRWFFE